MTKEIGKKVAVLGLGAMGSRMAKRLLAAGHEVVVYNRTAAAGSELVSQGARFESLPREAARGCQTVIACVRDDQAARAVWLDPETGAFQGMASGSIAIESSTLTPQCIGELYSRAQAAGISLLDAPVVGSRPQAEGGQLSYLVGGDSASLEQVRPLLGNLGAQIFHVGESGSGALFKLAVNALLGIQVAGLAELLAFLQKAGIGAAAATDVLAQLPVTSLAAKSAGALLASNQHAPLFPIELVEKDLGYATETAKALGTEVPVSTQVRALYASAKAEGRGSLNMTAVRRIA